MSDPRSRHVSWVALLIAALVLTLGTAHAQSIRQLGMGGVIAPGNAAAANPAYAPISDERVSIPLPLGLIPLLTNPSTFDVNSDEFDVLYIADQVARIDAWLISAAQAPEEIIVSVTEGADGPVLQIETVGGSPIGILEGASFAVGPDFELPIRVPAGPVSVGVRPFVTTDLRWTPDADLTALFRDGTASGGATLSAEAEAGVALDVTYGLQIPVPEDAYPGSVYVGGTVSPFVSLARATADVTAEVTAANAELDYTLDGNAFIALVSEGQVGFGATADLGVSTVVVIPEGTVNAGLSARGLGFGVYSGSSYTVDETGLSAPTESSGAEFLGIPDLVATASIDVSAETLGVPEIGSLLVAGDLAYESGRIAAHAGLEAGFGVEELGTIFARAGAGYDGGFVFGVGAGLDVLQIVGIDVALYGSSSLLTRSTSYGLSAGVSFGF